MVRIPADVDVFYAGLIILIHLDIAILIYSNTVGFQQIVVNQFTDGRKQRVDSQLDKFTFHGHRAPAPAGIFLAQLHPLAGQDTVFQSHRGQQFLEDDAIVQRVPELLQIGGHLFASATVKDVDILDAINPHGGPGAIHGAVAAADNGDVFPKPNRVGIDFVILKEFDPAKDLVLIALNLEQARFPGANSQVHIIKTSRHQDLNIELRVTIHLEMDAHRFDQLNVIFQGPVREAKIGDAMSDHASGSIHLVKYGQVVSLPGQEISQREAGRAGTDHGNATIAFRLPAGERVQEIFKAPLGSDTFQVADQDPIVIIVAHTLELASVFTDEPGHKGEWILGNDQCQGLDIAALSNQADVFGHILADRASHRAGRDETIKHIQALLDLHRLIRVADLPVTLVYQGSVGEQAELLQIDLAGRRRFERVFEHNGQLVQTGITAGFEQVGGHGDRADTSLENLDDVEIVGATGVRNRQLAIELIGQFLGQVDRQGVQSPPAHIHLIGGQAAFVVDNRQGIRQLDPKCDVVLVGKINQFMEHLDGIAIVHIMEEFFLFEGDMVVTKPIEDIGDILVTMQGRIQFDEGVHPLFGDQILANRFLVFGGTSVHRREGDRVGDVRRNPIDKPGVGDARDAPLVDCRFETLSARLENLRLGGVLEPLDESIDLGGFDPLQVIAHAHIEDKSAFFGLGQPKHFVGQMNQEPAFDIFGEGLFDLELGGPFRVVAFIGHIDAGLLDVEFIHDLDGLQLEETPPGEISGDEILGHLGVGPGRGPDGGLTFLAKNLERGILLFMKEFLLRNIEDPAVAPVFFQHPGEQGIKFDWVHYIAHWVSFFRFVRSPNSISKFSSR